MELDIKEIHNLAFEGGGVRGASFAGALDILGQRGLLKKCCRFAGTSIGGIVAACCALGYTPEEIVGIVMSLDWAALSQGDRSVELSGGMGVYRGQGVLEFCRSIVAKKFGSDQRDMTFATLKRLTGNDLVLVATNLSTMQKEYFGTHERFHADSRNTPVCIALRITISLPLIFHCVRLGECRYVDGGMLENFPIKVFDAWPETSPRQTLGLKISVSPVERLLRGDKLQPDCFGFWGGAWRLARTAWEGWYRGAGMEDDVANSRTLRITVDPSVSSMDFDLSESGKRMLVEQGRCSAFQFLEKACIQP